MGAWGTGILDNDEALDIYTPYVESFRNGISLTEIKADFKDRLYYESEPVLEDNAGSWLGYAQAQLDTNTVDDKTIDVIGQILDEKIDAEYWEDQEMLHERMEAIKRLYLELQKRSKF